MTLNSKTLIDVWYEVAEGVKRAGLAKVLFLNAHGGQPQVMEIVARDLRVRLGMMAVTSNWWHMGLPEGLVPPEERRHGIHGGTVETSLMLHLRPGLVRMEKAQDFRTVLPDIEERYKRLRMLGGIGIAWQAQDVHPLGVAGDATKATADLGRQITEHVSAGFAELIAEVSAYPLSAIVSR